MKEKMQKIVKYILMILFKVKQLGMRSKITNFKNAKRT